MKLTSLDITINLITSVAMLVIVFLLILLWKKQTRGLLSWVGVGCIVWIVAVLLKATIAFSLNEHIFKYLKSLLSNSGYVIVGSIWLGLLTGITEISIGYLVAKNRKYISFQQGSGYGLGFGVIEASLMAIGFAILVLIQVYMPGNLPNDVLGLIQNISWDTVGTVNLERFLAFIIHITCGILIVYSLSSKKLFYFWIAFVFKSTVDAVAGSLHLAGVATKWSPWLIDVLFIPFAIFGVWISINLFRKWPVKVSTD